MHESLTVQLSKATDNIQCQTQTIGGGQAAEALQIGAERAGGVSLQGRKLGRKVGRWESGKVSGWDHRRRVSSPFFTFPLSHLLFRRIGQSHHIVEVTRRIIASDVEHVNHPVGTRRHRLIALDSSELTFVWPVTVKL